MRFSHLFMPLALVSAIASVQAHASESFTVQDVRMSGLIRLTPANVQPYLPISVGDQVNEAVIAQSVSSLYASGLFEDVKSSAQDGIVTFEVVERPVISKIKLNGNKLLQKDMLLDGLKKMGIAEGNVYKQSAMHTIETELEQQYAQQGRYNADITIETLETANNRVEVTINFNEGLPAKVVDINVIGNTVFKESEIKQAFAVKESDWSTVLSRKDRYAREKMAASLEALRTMYLNNGYINFEIENSQLDISEDKRQIFIEVKIKEGQKFNFGQSKFLGDAMFKAEDLDALRVYKEGDTYSQAQVNAVRQLLLNKYGNAGYYFTEINIIPKIDEETKTVDLNYYINPGQQVRVRRINFSGNTKTADEVLRREMRQMEGALTSNEKIELSKIRLERTGFFKTVDMNIVRVPNVPDEVDIDVKVEEQHSGSTTFAVGYSQSGGMTFQAGLSQTNFLGTGNRVGIDLTRSQTQDYYNFSVLNPYYTIDGVSRGFNAYYRKTKDNDHSVTNYATDSFGGNITFGYPLDENQSVSATFGVDKTSVRTGQFASTYVRDYLMNNGGKVTALYPSDAGARADKPAKFSGDFLTYNVNLAWAYNTLNRPVFPTSGMYHRVGLEVAVPGSDVDYQKLTYDFQGMLPLWKGFALRGYGRLGYGNDMPFYKNYFAGGFGSVRGYEISTLGPRYDRNHYAADPSVGDPNPEHVGGNALVQFGTELVLPLPFKGDWTRQVRPVLFAEGAQVFDTQCKGFNANTRQFNRADNTLVSAKQYCKDNYSFDMNNMRYSVGAGFTWLTMIGPISLSYAYPLNQKDGDETKNVQFEIGRTF